MKHFIRAISTSLALLTTISTCVISVNAKQIRLILQEVQVA